MKISEFDNFGVEEMNKEDYARNQTSVMEKCLCPSCPTYVEGDTPFGYCYPMSGTSKNITSEKDCVCKSCPVFKEYELDHSFYCTRCSQLCQIYKKIEVCAGP